MTLFMVYCIAFQTCFSRVPVS